MKLSVRNLAIRYEGEQILSQLNMDVREGEFVSILGPSGCGKSTLLNILAGVLPAEEGSVSVDGEPVRGLSTHFAYMPQDDLLMPWKTILENVCLYGAVHGQRAAARKKAEANLERFGLAGYKDRYPRELSGGMRQRAAFLRTALCPADIMLLDEPFASLDVITRGRMQEWLRSMRETLSGTTLLVTHDIDEAIYLSDRVLVLTGKPASFKIEVEIKAKGRDRNWLFQQAALKNRIHSFLENDHI